MPFRALAAFDPCAESPVTRGFVESLVGSSPPFLSRISAADEMYRYNLDSLRGSREGAAILYYAKGWQIFQTVQNVARWRFGDMANVRSLLDFASGYGRLTRFLIREIQPERICVSEIHADAVAFQQESFGVDGFVSTADADDLVRDRRFALVIASSFFSHLPGPSFRAWIGALLGCVEPEGVLLFSTLGSELLVARDRSEGIVFLPESETDRLDKETYGTAYVTESYVNETIKEAGGEKWSVSRFPRGLCGLQDLYVVAGDGASSSAGIEATYFPWGDADLYEIRGEGRLRVAGWARTVEGAPPVHRVTLFINNLRVALCDPGSPEPGVFRWSFEIDASRIAPDDVMSVRAATADGLENIVALGTLRTHPPAKA